MNSSAQSLLDKLSIGASVLCAVQCIATPLLLAVYPSLWFLPEDEHAFHLALILFILPMSVIAGFSGCKQHKDPRVVIGISTGLALLVLTALFGHDLVGETGEKVATILASLILAFAHLRNYRLCRARSCQHC